VSTAQRILVLYGITSLAVGFALGMALSRERTRAPAASHHLVTAHLSALMQGTMHLALVVALELSTLSDGVEVLAAGLLAIGSATFVAGTIANWRQGVGDHFAARSLGWRLLAGSSVGHIGGLSVIATGVLLAV
jgi:hypothetical protein